MKIIAQIFLFSITLSSFSQNSFPTYNEVVGHLYTNYKVDAIDEIKIILLEKREIGWKLTTIDSQSKDTISEVLWDSSKKQYNTISFPPNPSKIVDEDVVENFIARTTSLRFNNLKYYGYVGWDIDVINFYENKNQLTDVELYSLGYAYSHHASGFLNDNFEFSDSKINMNLPISKNAMTNAQLQTYLLFQNKAINSYKELYKRNPKFETIPGEIGIKYHNEIASCFLNLRIYQNEQIAMEQIQGIDLYTENYKMYAKDMLDSCEKNAILFTVGDNDTFPLLMYQVQNNYRKDVLIVNTSLLQDSRYIIMMKDRVLDSEGIKLSIHDEFIKDKLSEFLLFNISTDDFISIEDLDEIVLNESNSIEGYSVLYKTISSNNFKFSNNTSVLNWSIDGQAIYRNHLMLLDIIATNKWKRPIYFTINNTYDNYVGLSNFLQFEGLVYKLVSSEGIMSDDQIGFVNPSKLEENISKMYNFKNKMNLPIEERQLIMDFRLIYNRLANYYIAQDNFKKAESILDECLTIYPNEMAYFSFDAASIIESYYKINSFEKGKTLQNQLFENFKKGFDNYSFLNDEERKVKYDNAKKYLLSLNEKYGID